MKRMRFFLLLGHRLGLSSVLSPRVLFLTSSPSIVLCGGLGGGGTAVERSCVGREELGPAAAAAEGAASASEEGGREDFLFFFAELSFFSERRFFPLPLILRPR